MGELVEVTLAAAFPLVLRDLPAIEQKRHARSQLVQSTLLTPAVPTNPARFGNGCQFVVALLPCLLFLALQTHSSYRNR